MTYTNFKLDIDGDGIALLTWDVPDRSMNVITLQGIAELSAIDGVLLTMYDSRLNLSRQVAEDAREYFGPKVFKNVVPRNVRLAEAPSFGKPIILYDVASVGAQAYMNVAKELIERTAQGDDGGT